MSQPSLKIKDTVETVVCLVLVGLVIVRFKSFLLRVTSSDVKHVADARAAIKDRHGSEALHEAEAIVDSALPIATILNWPNHIIKEIN